MINLVVIAVSAILLAVLLVWRRWPAFRSGIEAPKFFMLRQERRFDDRLKGRTDRVNGSLAGLLATHETKDNAL